MGTWDTGPFDNDTAADFCDDLDVAPRDARAETVRDVLLRTVRTTEELDADVAEKAIAAAALVAAQCPRGEPVETPYGPDEPLPDLTGLRALAEEAVARVLTAPSTLLDDWEGDRAWRSRRLRLLEVLSPEPVGEQLALY
ncbi:DUF4259 domain-containing protein [Streptomyces sp. NPDC002644]